MKFTLLSFEIEVMLQNVWEYCAHMMYMVVIIGGVDGVVINIDDHKAVEQSLKYGWLIS